MRVPRVPVRLILALTLVVGSALLFSSTNKPVFRPTVKAYYADAATVNFVRPGLVVQITAANIASDGTVKVSFTVADPMGLPLDISGVDSPGPISTKFVIATIPSGQTQYVSYITRTNADPASGRTTQQATSDSGGKYTPGVAGQYTYTFKTKVATAFNSHNTHSIGVWASRDLSEFNLTSVINYSSNVYTFVPDGSPVKVTRDVIRTQSCEKCHTGPFTMHDERHGVELCVMCHTPQSADAVTGNTLDMKVMIHKIHMGSQLPSVAAGTPYQIAGHSGNVDFSGVVFPADPRNCTFCHEQKTGAAQATAYLQPSRAACGSCHDNVNFATGQNHLNLPQIDDNQCANCHIPQGELEFDASIIGAHTIPTSSTTLQGVVFGITGVTNTAPGQHPTVTFTLKDNSGNAIDISKMARLALVMGGPTTDYAGYVSENVLKAAGSGSAYTWTMQNAIPAGAKGSFSVGIEGYKQTTLLPGTVKAQTINEAGANKVFTFSVDGSPVQPRRQVVSIALCNNCHSSLSMHGGNRNQIEQCAMCHNPNEGDEAFRPKAQAPTQSVQFAHMIHRIHTGNASTQEFTIYGYGGSTNDFTKIEFPGDRRDCAMCHVNGSEQLPLADGLLQVQSARTPLNPMGPATAACTGCHTDIPTASHALSNTTTLGEACAACHSSSADFSTSAVHAR
jgi:OmcA/MtrC family decaheme c-type cytochrome